MSSRLSRRRRSARSARPARSDVEGWDARSKLCILAKMSFGLTLDENALWCQGIPPITGDDFAYAKELGCTIKILGVTYRKESGAVTAYVSPTLVKADSPIGVTAGATNLVSLSSDNIGDSTYIGAGAGRWPTAQSVVA